MPVFMYISRHTPDNCPAFHEKHRKSTVEFIATIDSLTKKHGIKVLGSWTDFPEHIIYMVFEGSPDAMQKFQMEPCMMAWLSWNTMERKTVSKNEEILKMLKKPKRITSSSISSLLFSQLIRSTCKPINKDNYCSLARASFFGQFLGVSKRL
jgi:hypothetical protein